MTETSPRHAPWGLWSHLINGSRGLGGKPGQEAWARLIHGEGLEA